MKSNDTVRALWLQFNFIKECGGCVFEGMATSQARSTGTFKDQSAHKPQIHQVYNVLLSVRTKLRSHTTDLGPSTSTILQKETDGRRWYTDNDKK